MGVGRHSDGVQHHFTMFVMDGGTVEKNIRSLIIGGKKN
jgi:hypothetical protein